MIKIIPDELNDKRGRPREGLYPEKSRTLLAARLGVHVRVVSRILTGARPVSLKLAGPLARMIGIPMEKLERDLRNASLARKEGMKK
jgi:plasmid maintenance system antidote protein VapI